MTKLAPRGPAGKLSAGRNAAFRMPHLNPVATPIEILEATTRRFTVAAMPNWGLLALAISFFIGAYAVGGWALYNGVLGVPLIDSIFLYTLVLVMVHFALYYLVMPLGTEQVFSFDKAANRLVVTTRGLLRNRQDAYRLNEVVKLHFNRVDDGIYDKYTMLVVFRGGGTLQFPQHRGDPARVERMVNQVVRFLDVERSDTSAAALTRPMRDVRDEPKSPSDAEVMDHVTRHSRTLDRP